MASTFTTQSWREIVEQSDDEDRHFDNIHPEVYFFSFQRTFRDTGPMSGIYAGDT